jgi:hypothetical protein
MRERWHGWRELIPAAEPGATLQRSDPDSSDADPSARRDGEGRTALLRVL